ncbi:hypothetical protein D1610_13755 [Sphingomonas gilva]|uniref:Uncharacterized protein n=1 Tax=Sphingomonas gilva TaxID=2305907 RepID=A0A396RKK2_9SPHN|nr:hypothetical protein [Sphingomonas gilva]RHW16788.1 hypothetical protein D1610_13755 [Sphingomonas gilva]
MRWLPLAVWLIIAAPVAAEDDVSRYAAGQVWEYRTRAGEEGSLLKIQQVEQAPRGTVYHISLIGLSFGRGMPHGGELGHMPVSRETLDASVTRLSDSKAEFPDPASGIAAWREAEGGVFTIPVAEIVENILSIIATGAVATKE